MLADIKAVAQGEEKTAFNIALWLAFFNQATASSAIINYAPQLLRETGIHNETLATLLTSTVTGAKVSLARSVAESRTVIHSLCQTGTRSQTRIEKQ